MENSIEYKELFERALEAARSAYAPYSKFRVGAALLLNDGEIITGVNVENRSFGLTNCAERSAVYTAVSAGKLGFKAIAIATPDSEYPVSPCGACRQVLSEFMKADAPILFGPVFEKAIYSSLSELYPFDALHELAKS
ncbi:cytidine deaminase [Treponema zuelzerae]|uniref:Cytidine deaminase n=1 Tax=Teretinema zuelzerae TaxID=156 RepID=A0AAE3EFE0_9SPIR|nr:cytidine deaminase [Teretinema zuelzerae]MCD1653302.1 cytidine deaminase [Teretinema zuelzerae]HPO03422.1 cytidine deaminase [Treponemataceae bacterium]